MKKQLFLLSLSINLISASELDIGIGVGVMEYPDYLGSENSNTLAIPYPFFWYRSENLNIDGNGLKKRLFSINNLSLRLSMSGSLPVKSSGARDGMADLDPAGEIGPALVYTFYDKDGLDIKFDLPIRAVVSSDFQSTIDYRGYLSDPKIAVDYDFGEKYLFQFQTGGVWADSRYHNYLYGVDDSFVTDSRKEYSTKAGYSGYKTSMGISKVYEKAWIGAFVRHYTLSGSVFGDSPLKRKNSAIYAGLFVAYLFDKDISNKVKSWID